MATRKDIVVVLLITALLLVSGCASQKKTAQTTATGQVFAGGSEGLALSWIPGEPPAETFKGDTFSIGVQVQNKGEYDVTNLVAPLNVFFSGIDAVSFSKVNTDFVLGYGQGLTAELTPVKYVGSQKIMGGTKTVQVDGLDYKYDIVGQYADFTAVATACYPYQTQAVALACASENLLKQTVGKEICKISGEKNPQSWGAPVKVTSVVELPAGQHRVGFQIKVKDQGNGFTFQQGADCRTVSPAKQNVVYVTAFLGDAQLACSPATGKVTLSDTKEGTITCYQDITPSGQVQIPLKVVVDYDYSSQISQKFRVKRAEV